MSSDGGALLLQAADGVPDVIGRMAGCFVDYRDPVPTEHGLEALLRQRVFGIGMGHEDLNDHDEIRRDSVLALACGRDHRTGQKRARARDREHPLAGSSTLSRLEPGTPGSAESHRYKKIMADPEKLWMPSRWISSRRCIRSRPRRRVRRGPSGGVWGCAVPKATASGMRSPNSATEARTSSFHSRRPPCAMTSTPRGAAAAELSGASQGTGDQGSEVHAPGVQPAASRREGRGCGRERAYSRGRRHRGTPLDIQMRIILNQHGTAIVSRPRRVRQP